MRIRSEIKLVVIVQNDYFGFGLVMVVGIHL